MPRLNTEPKAPQTKSSPKKAKGKTKSTAAQPASTEPKKDKRGGCLAPPTRTHPKTGKIMTREQIAKEDEKASKDSERRQKIQEREEKAAKRKSEREEKEAAKSKKQKEKDDKATAKQREEDQGVEKRNRVADALLTECKELNIKTPSFRKLVREQGESLDVDGEGKVVVLDARGQNPIAIGPYLKSLGEDVTNELRKSERKRKTGWPKRERKPKVKPEDHGVVKIGAKEPSLPIDKKKPWADFPVPQGVLMNIHDAVVTPNMVTVGEGDETKQVMSGLRLTAKGEDLGVIDREAARELGRMVGFKVDFVDKLSSAPELATQVVNHMIGEYRPQLMMFAGDAERVRDVCPGWRATTSHSEVCQKAWNVMDGSYKDVEVRTCQVNRDGSMELILTTDVGKGQVTKAVGDYLKGGIRVTHRYGTDIKVGLFVERLSCLNGMTSCSTSYSWTTRGAGSIEAQLAYLEVQAFASMEKLDALVANAKKMAATKVSGDPEQAIKERMKQMGVPAKYLESVLDAFKQEPGDTEWHMLNSITRFATHSMGIGRGLREALMEGSGDWVRQFDVVKARMPRSIARRVGAEILAED